MYCFRFFFAAIFSGFFYFAPISTSFQTLRSAIIKSFVFCLFTFYWCFSASSKAKSLFFVRNFSPLLLSGNGGSVFWILSSILFLGVISWRLSVFFWYCWKWYSSYFQKMCWIFSFSKWKPGKPYSWELHWERPAN